MVIDQDYTYTIYVLKTILDKSSKYLRIYTISYYSRRYMHNTKFRTDTYFKTIVNVFVKCS